MINGVSPEKIEQRIDCGAIVRLDDPTIEHGILLIHPALPPIKLYIKLDPEGKKLPGYHFEPITADHGDKTVFAINLHEPQKTIIQPERKLVVPGNDN